MTTTTNSDNTIATIEEKALSKITDIVKSDKPNYQKLDLIKEATSCFDVDKRRSLRNGN